MKTHGIAKMFSIMSVVVLLVGEGKDALAQSVFGQTGRDNLFTFEITRPEFDGNDNTSFITSASFVGLRIAAGNNVMFVTDLPFAILGSDAFDDETAIGNPFASNPERGVYRSRDGGASWEQVLHVSDETGAVDLEFAPDNPDEIYATMWRAESIAL